MPLSGRSGEMGSADGYSRMASPLRQKILVADLRQAWRQAGRASSNRQVDRADHLAHQGGEPFLRRRAHRRARHGAAGRGRVGKHGAQRTQAKPLQPETVRSIVGDFSGEPPPPARLDGLQGHFRLAGTSALHPVGHRSPAAASGAVLQHTAPDQRLGRAADARSVSLRRGTGHDADGPRQHLLAHRQAHPAGDGCPGCTHRGRLPKAERNGGAIQSHADRGVARPRRSPGRDAPEPIADRVPGFLQHGSAAPSQPGSGSGTSSRGERCFLRSGDVACRNGALARRATSQLSPRGLTF